MGGSVPWLDLNCKRGVRGEGGGAEELMQPASLLPYYGWDPPSCFEPWLPGKDDENLEL